MNVSAAEGWIENRYVCGSVILALSSFALFANIEICFYHRLPNNRPIVSLSIASIFYQLANIFVYVPCAFTSCPFYSPGVLKLLATPNACYNICLLCFVHLSVERMLVFYCDSLHRGIQTNAMKVIAGIWLYMTILTATSSCFGCIKTFDPIGLSFKFAMIDSPFVSIFLVHTIIFAAIMVTCYLMIFIKIRYIMYTHKRRQKKEIELYLFVCSFAWLSMAFFYSMPTIRIWFQSKLTLIPPAFSTIASSSHCYIFFLFNRKLRRAACNANGKTSVTGSTVVKRRSGPATIAVVAASLNS